MSGGILSRKVIVQTPFEPIDVLQKSANFLEFNEISSLAGLGTANILNFTVSVGTRLELIKVSFSGQNLGIYSLKINSVVKAKHRTNYTEFNGVMDFNSFDLQAGDVVVLEVENATNETADFSANVLGRTLNT